MDLKESIDELQKKYENFKGKRLGERRTEAKFIEPFLDFLGYNVHNDTKSYLVQPQYIIDHKAKKPYKVDYAILKKNGKPTIFVEGKPLDENLDQYHSQLKKYFNVNKDVEFAIITNGNEYQFYTDIEDKNQLDEKPFLRFCLKEINNEIIEALNLFSSKYYDPIELKKHAKKRRNISALEKQFKSPEDEFVSVISKYIFRSQKRASLCLVKDFILKLSSKLPDTPSDITTEPAKSPLPLKPNEVNFFELGDLGGKKIISYRWEGQLKECKFWAELIVDIFKNLYKEDEEKFIVINKKMSHRIRIGKYKLSNPKHIYESFFIDTNTINNTKKADILLLLEHFEKKDSLYVTLRN